MGKNIKQDPCCLILGLGAIIIGGSLTASSGLIALGGLTSPNPDHQVIGVIHGISSILNLIFYTTIATKSLSGTLYKK